MRRGNTPIMASLMAISNQLGERRFVCTLMALTTELACHLCGHQRYRTSVMWAVPARLSMAIDREVEPKRSNKAR